MGASNSTSGPTTEQTYGYGFLATFITCLASVVGIVVFYLVPRGEYDRVTKLLGSMAVGTLVGDAILHLIPTALGLHSHEQEHLASVSEKNIVLKLTIVIVGVYVFYLLDMVLKKLIDFVHMKWHESQNEVCNLDTATQSTEVVGKPEDSLPQQALQVNECACGAQAPTEASFQLWENKKGSRWNMKKAIKCLKAISAYTWCLLIADMIHNLADGVALGAAFAKRLDLGLTTSLAVLFHELPHELGDYAVLVESGLTHWQALLLNFITGLTALFGFFIGAALSRHSEDALEWILAFTAGIFLYVSLTGILPRICPNSGECNSCKCLLICAGGIAIGIVLMFLLAYFEHDLNSILEKT